MWASAFKGFFFFYHKLAWVSGTACDSHHSWWSSLFIGWTGVQRSTWLGACDNILPKLRPPKLGTGNSLEPPNCYLKNLNYSWPINVSRAFGWKAWKLISWHLPFVFSGDSCPIQWNSIILRVPKFILKCNCIALYSLVKSHLFSLSINAFAKDNFFSKDN